MRRTSFLSAWLLLAASPLLVLACRGSQSPSGATPAAGRSPSSSASGPGEQVLPGVVGTPPPGVTQVAVTLKEWAVTTDKDRVKAGSMYFLVENAGPEDPHELVIVRSELAPDRLPVVEGRVPENQVQLLDEIEPFLPRSKASKVVNLTPGKYVFLCNIAEMESGKLESHYQLGMRTAFTVE